MQYNFSVTGVNSAGRGRTSSTVQFSTPQGGTVTLTVLYHPNLYYNSCNCTNVSISD